MGNAKKKRHELTQYYRWQFLRRNAEYQHAYDLYKEEKSAIKKNPAIYDKEKELSLISHDIVDKYSVNRPYDYRKKAPYRSLRIYGEVEAPFAV